MDRQGSDFMRADGRWLVIFDCDGVLVDSEPIALSVLGELLALRGLRMERDELSTRFLGRSLRSVIEAVAAEDGLMLPEDFAMHLRQELFARFEQELQPMSGISAVLDGLESRGIAFCVASSSQVDRIERSLSITGLLPRFSGRIYSATMVQHGKPAPDLFMLAAGSQNVPAENCIVVEDSPAGIEAANAAAMRVFAFTGGGHTKAESYMRAIARTKVDARFDLMPELLQRVDLVRNSEASLNG